MIGAFFIENLTAGFAVAGVLMFLGGLVAVIILPKEQSADFLPKEEGSFKDVLVSFRPPKFAGAHDFYKAFAGRFCMIMSYQMINVYQLYIIQNYIGQSVKESAVTVSVVSMLMMVMSLVGSFISGPVSDLIGRRKVPVVVASVLFAIGIAMPWLIPSTLGMYLFAGIAGLGYAVYSAVDQALLVDVLPNKEEAGKDLGILNMGTTLGQMCGPVIMSTIVVSLGYNFAFPTAIALAISVLPVPGPTSKSTRRRCVPPIDRRKLAPPRNRSRVRSTSSLIGSTPLTSLRRTETCSGRYSTWGDRPAIS